MHTKMLRLGIGASLTDKPSMYDDLLLLHGKLMMHKVARRRWPVLTLAAMRNTSAFLHVETVQSDSLSCIVL